MKKVVGIIGWIVTLLYGVFMTIAAVAHYKAYCEEVDEINKINDRHERIREKVRKEGIWNLDDYFKKQDETIEQIGELEGDEYEDAKEEYWTRNILYNSLNKVKYEWLR